jgi:hypothetical protein
VSKKINAVANADSSDTQKCKGEVTLSGFSGFDATDIPEMQTLLQQSLKKLKQFQDTDDVKREVLVTGFEKMGDSLNIKYRTTVQRLSRKSIKVDAAIPLEEGELLHTLQQNASQSFAKKFNVESVAVLRQDLVDPAEEAAALAAAAAGTAVRPAGADASVDGAAGVDDSELSNITGYIELDGVSKARLNRSPKVLNAVKTALLKHANNPELDLSADAVTITSIRTQADKSVKVNYRIDLQGGTATAAEGAVQRLARGMNGPNARFMEDVEKEAVALGEPKLGVLEKMKVKQSKSERVAAAPKKQVKTAAEMVDATRKMLSVAKVAEAPTDDGEDIVETRRSRRSRSSSMADTVTRTASAEVGKDDEEADLMERRRRRQARGQRRKEDEDKSPAATDGDTISKISSRRQRSRGGDDAAAAPADGAEDERRSRREERRARRGEAKSAKGEDTGTGTGTGTEADSSASPARRERRSARGEAKSTGTPKREEDTGDAADAHEAQSKAKEANTQAAQGGALESQSRSRWNNIRDTLSTTRRPTLRLSAISGESGSGGGGAEGGEGKSKQGSPSSKAFDDTTAALLDQVREAKAERSKQQAMRATGIGRSITKARSRAENKVTKEDDEDDTLEKPGLE